MNARVKAEFFLFSITLIWGTTFVTTKIVLEHVSPFLYIAIRFFAASILFGALFFRQVRMLGTSAVLKGAILGLFLFIGFALQTVGLEYTTASKSAFVTGMLVVLTPLCQIIIERRMPNAGNVVGVILVTAGLYFLTSPQGAKFNIGDALTLGCALCFALYIVYLDMFTKEFNVAQLTFVQFATAAVGGGFVALAVETRSLELNATFVGAVSYLVVMATVVALYVQTKYQKETTPTRAAIIFSVEPVIAAIFAYFVLGEKIGWLGILGGGLIMAGLIVSQLSDLLLSVIGIAKNDRSSA